MGRSASVIEINGSSYDAATGDVIGTVKRMARSVRDNSSSRVIDGFTKRKLVTQAPIATKPKPAGAKTSRGVKSSAKKVHRRPEHSATLVRSVVVKPTLRIRQATKNFARSPRETLSNTLRIDIDRQARVGSIAKHDKVSRFGSSQKKTVEPIKAQVGEVVTATKTTIQASPVRAVTSSMPSTVASASHARLERMLDKALFQASAHKQTLTKRTGRFVYIRSLPKWIMISFVVVVVATIVALVAWRNIPAVAVRLAAVRSHITATVPSFTPTDYSFDTATSQPGAVSIKYTNKLNSSNSYTVIQKESRQDSSSLVANTVPKNTQTQNFQNNGVMITSYSANGENVAVCVNNGTQVTVSGTLDLTSAQKVASNTCSN